MASFLVGYFVKEIENISPAPCSQCYRNARGSLGELEIAYVETLALQACVANSISRSPKPPLVFLFNK